MGPCALGSSSLVVTANASDAVRMVLESTTTPRSLPAAARAAWQHLVGMVVSPPPTRPVALPAPVVRWWRHVLGDAPAPTRAKLTMHGEIRLGRWRPFTAVQLLTPKGLVWAARVGRWPLRITGADRYIEGVGTMNWRLAGLLPVLNAGGPDITRSAAGRHAAELVALLPGAVGEPTLRWLELDETTARARVAHGTSTHEVTIRVDEVGALRTVSLPRWGNPDGGAFAEHRFGVDFADEVTFGGITMPRTLRAGWWHGTPRAAAGEFFRATIDHAMFW